MNWTYPSTETITGNTKVKEADNKIQNAMNDLVAWVNGTGIHTGTGFKDDVLVEVNTTIDAFLVSAQTQLDSIIYDTVVVEW